MIAGAAIGHEFFAVGELWVAVFGASISVGMKYPVGQRYLEDTRDIALPAAKGKEGEVEITLFFMSSDGCLPILHDKTDHIYSLPQLANQDWVCPTSSPRCHPFSDLTLLIAPLLPCNCSRLLEVNL